MPGLKSMSVEELETYRDEQQVIINRGKAEFRKAGLELKRRTDKDEVIALKAQRDKLDAQIAVKEGSDG